MIAATGFTNQNADQVTQVSHTAGLVLLSVTQGELSDVLEFSPERAEQVACQLQAAARLARREAKR